MNGAKFCTKCGFPMGYISELKTYVCHYCGSHVKAKEE